MGLGDAELLFMSLFQMAGPIWKMKVAMRATTITMAVHGMRTLPILIVFCGADLVLIVFCGADLVLIVFCGADLVLGSGADF